MDFNSSASGHSAPDNDNNACRSLLDRADHLIVIIVNMQRGTMHESMRTSAKTMLDTDWETLVPGKPMHDVRDKYIRAASDAQAGLYEATIMYLQAFEQRRHVLRNGLLQDSINRDHAGQEMGVLAKARDAYQKMAARAAVAVNSLGLQDVDIDVSDRVPEREELLELEDMPEAMLQSLKALQGGAAQTLQALCDVAEIECAYAATLHHNEEGRDVISNHTDKDYLSVKNKELAIFAEQLAWLKVAVSGHAMAVQRVENTILKFGNRPDHGQDPHTDSGRPRPGL